MHSHERLLVFISFVFYGITGVTNDFHWSRLTVVNAVM